MSLKCNVVRVLVQIVDSVPSCCLGEHPNSLARSGRTSVDDLNTLPVLSSLWERHYLSCGELGQDSATIRRCVQWSGAMNQGDSVSLS